MICNCCGQPITPATISREHVYRLALYAFDAKQNAAVRYGYTRRAVCAKCVGRIEAAYQQRRKRSVCKVTFAYAI